MDILSEKPITDAMDSTCRVYKKVLAAGKKMAVTLSHRFDQDKQSLEHAIKSGDYTSYYERMYGGRGAPA